MIETVFDCPETGKPLRWAAGAWPGRGTELLSIHCPKCGRLHSFHQAESALAGRRGPSAGVDNAKPAGAL